MSGCTVKRHVDYHLWTSGFLFTRTHQCGRSVRERMWDSTRFLVSLRVCMCACVCHIHLVSAAKKANSFSNTPPLKVTLGEVCPRRATEMRRQTESYRQKDGRRLFRGRNITIMFWKWNVFFPVVCQVCVSFHAFVPVHLYLCELDPLSGALNFLPADVSLHALDCLLWISILFRPTDLPLLICNFQHFLFALHLFVAFVIQSPFIYIGKHLGFFSRFTPKNPAKRCFTWTVSKAATSEPQSFIGG